MNVGIYSFYDKVTHTYGEPFIAVNVESAIRRFNYLMSQSPMVADDMQLYCLGNLNTDTGVISSCVDFVANYEVKE